MSDPVPGVEHADPDYQPASTLTLVLIFAFVGAVLALLGYLVFANMPEQSDDEWIDNAPVVEQGLDSLYVEDVTVIREMGVSGRTLVRSETILADGTEVDCQVFDDEPLDIRCKEPWPLHPEPQS